MESHIACLCTWHGVYVCAGSCLTLLVAPLLPAGQGFASVDGAGQGATELPSLRHPPTIRSCVEWTSSPLVCLESWSTHLCVFAHCVGTVTFRSVSDAEAAAALIHNTTIDGTILTAEQTTPASRAPPRYCFIRVPPPPDSMRCNLIELIESSSPRRKSVQAVQLLDGEVTTDVKMVPGLVGLMIGRDGVGVKSLQEKTGVRSVKVRRLALSTDTLCTGFVSSLSSFLRRCCAALLHELHVNPSTVSTTVHLLDELICSRFW
jgi:hypothetical protein